MNKKIVCLFGTTASGKTQLAHKLFHCFNVSLISVDSGAIYKEISIGTTKPNKTEEEKFGYQLINMRSLNERFSVSAFIKHASSSIQNAWNEEKVPFLVGGSMMYFNALFNGISNVPACQIEIQKALQRQLKQQGSNSLFQELEALDPLAAKRIHSNDIQRVIRALEVYKSSGETLSSFQNKKRAPFPKHMFFNIALTGLPETLSPRITKRFDSMLEEGIINETISARERFFEQNLPAMKLIGYQQICNYLDENHSEKYMRERTIFATKHLAKHQNTWIKKTPTQLALNLEKHSTSEQFLLAKCFLENALSPK